MSEDMSPARTDETMDRMKGAVRTLLEGVGEDVSREGLLDTPKRVAKALLYMTGGQLEDPKEVVCKAIFAEAVVAAENNNMVVVRDIDFASMCEETLLPFHGRVHIGYVPRDGRVLGLSKMSRLTSVFARRLQTQQRLAAEILDALMLHLGPKGAAIVVEAHHLGRPYYAPEIAVDTRGCCVGQESAAWQEFSAMLNMHGVSTVEQGPATARNGTSSPSESPTAAATAENSDPPPVAPEVIQRMEGAVNTLLREIGEDVNRQGLGSSAEAYVRWFMKTTEGYRDGGRRLKKGPSMDFQPEMPVVDMVKASLPKGMPNGAAPPQCVFMQVPFASQCEHHLLPFYGKATIALVPKSNESDDMLQLSMHEATDIVRKFSRRLQVQERLNIQIADAVNEVVSSSEEAADDGYAGLMVICDAKHMCMVARGVEKAASSTLTFAARGVLDRDAALRAQVLAAAAASVRRPRRPRRSEHSDAECDCCPPAA